MPFTAKVLMIDGEQAGFVSIITVDSIDRGYAVSDPKISYDSEAVTNSWDTAQQLTKKSMAFWGLGVEKLTYGIGESDLNRSSSSMEGTDGKSLGMAFYIASIAANLGLRLRQDVAFTGCLENAGDFRYPGALRQKILGRFGAVNAYKSKIKTVVVAPPPKGSSDIPANPAQEYLDILEQFQCSTTDRKYLTLEKVEDLWQPHIISQIFDMNSWFIFVLKNQKLFNRMAPPNPADSLESSISNLRTYYSENLWLDFDTYLAGNPDNIEYFLERLRDLALEYFTEKDAAGLTDLLSTLGRNMSYDNLLDFINKDDLLTAFGREFPNTLNDRYEESFANVRKAINEMTRENSLNASSLQQVVHTEFSSFNAYMNNMIRLLEVFFDIDPALAKESYNQVGLFAELETSVRQLEEDGGDSLVVFVNKLVWAEPIRQLARIKQGLLDNIEIDEQGQAYLTEKKIAMHISVKPDLSELRFDIIENTAKDLVNQENEKILPFMFPVKGNNAIQNPLLLWQQSHRSLCLDYQADNYDKNNCAIFNLPDGHFCYKDKEGKLHKSEGLIQMLFSSAPMNISFTSKKGTKTSVLWSNQYRWPPSIDSLWFASVLEQEGVCQEQNRLIADIGSGTGFLGIFYAQNCPHVRLATFSDINRSLTLLTEYNCKKNLHNPSSHNGQYKTITSRGLACYHQFVRDYGKLDLCISAPPYLPKVKEYGIASGLSVAVSGTKLLEELITEGSSITKSLIVQFSTIALPEFNQACEKAGVQAVCLTSRNVPVRIDMIQPYHPQLDYKLDPNDVRQKQRYQYLLERYQQLKEYNEFLQKQRNLKCLEKDNYKWWHELRVYRIDFD